MEQTTQTIGPWLKWAWRHYVMEVEDFDTLDDALAARFYASENGDEAFAFIEGPSGVVPDEVIDADEERRLAAERARWSGTPTPSHRLEILSPDGKQWATFGHYSTHEGVEYVAGPLRSMLGTERVRVR